MDHVRRHFPNRLRKYRMLMGYKQSEVAKLLGHVSTNRISHWENGEALPSLINLFKLSLLYHTLADQLYFDLKSEIKANLDKKTA